MSRIVARYLAEGGAATGITPEEASNDSAALRAVCEAALVAMDMAMYGPVKRKPHNHWWQFWRSDWWYDQRDSSRAARALLDEMERQRGW